MDTEFSKKGEGGANDGDYSDAAVAAILPLGRVERRGRKMEIKVEVGTVVRWCRGGGGGVVAAGGVGTVASQIGDYASGGKTGFFFGAFLR